MAISIENLKRYVAIEHDTDRIIATHDDFSICSALALEVSGYDMAPGTIAPYFITSRDWVR